MSHFDLFEEENYKTILQQTLLNKKKLRPHYTFEAMAKACGVQKTYLSRVLRHKGNLSFDQICLAGEFLRLKALEQEYLLVLYQREISISEKRKKIHEQKMNELRRKAFKTESKLSVCAQKAESIEIGLYYVDPYYSIIHMFLTLDVYLKEPMLMVKSLSLSEEKISKYLEDLEAMGIIGQDGKKWKVLQNSIHLPEESPFVKAHRNLLRLKAIEKMDLGNKKDFYSFSVVFSADEKVRQQAHQLFLKYIGEVQCLVQNSTEKEVYQLNFDLLKWT
jgi:hypothetical protein